MLRQNFLFWLYYGYFPWYMVEFETKQSLNSILFFVHPLYCWCFHSCNFLCICAGGTILDVYVHQLVQRTHHIAPQLCASNMLQLRSAIACYIYCQSHGSQITSSTTTGLKLEAMCFNYLFIHGLGVGLVTLKSKLQCEFMICVEF